LKDCLLVLSRGTPPYRCEGYESNFRAERFEHGSSSRRGAMEALHGGSVAVVASMLVGSRFGQAFSGESGAEIRGR